MRGRQCLCLALPHKNGGGDPRGKRRRGVLCLYGNYGGDKMNFRQAMEDCEELEDIRCAELLGTDDIASAPAEAADTRRGVAGIVYAYKIAGAAAEEMRSLDEVVRVTQKALQNIRTMGVALTPCVLPEVGKPTFSINEGEMEIGMGIHGETGISKSKVLTADETADMILEKIGRGAGSVRGEGSICDGKRPRRNLHRRADDRIPTDSADHERKTDCSDRASYRGICDLHGDGRVIGNGVCPGRGTEKLLLAPASTPFTEHERRDGEKSMINKTTVVKDFRLFPRR